MILYGFCTDVRDFDNDVIRQGTRHFRLRGVDEPRFDDAYALELSR